ncbi:hypothetical protein G5714_017853 [Onychostoma macrolepis]|uniref:Uncharacterized protein n=1 Tax=Onychostoma macrolepis TaxID=369639 RepID=A0A7J6C2Z4_9TELE|nr:hypothetical protein G5714_017853 [Onychostoma macrolepis]
MLRFFYPECCSERKLSLLTLKLRAVHPISITAQAERTRSADGREQAVETAKMAMRRGLSDKTSLKRRILTTRMASNSSDERADRNGGNMESEQLDER